MAEQADDTGLDYARSKQYRNVGIVEWTVQVHIGAAGPRGAEVAFCVQHVLSSTVRCH